MPKLDLDTIPQTNATGYPAEYADVVQGRWYRRLAPASGLTDFGASHVTLKPGAWSAHRHWHEGEDELVVMIVGEAVLVDDAGEHVMRPGDVAAFPKGDGNGHVLQNRSDADCVFVAIGRPAASDCHYPDIDMHLEHGVGFRRKDGSGF
ncbi:MULTISPECIES: cupin domain-containing protein [unclassified Sphingomonas]|uniref:cupin domain-containing protein n=1 Tax=unclassified Sphingomonas TaxID=196159 RepID=UPI002151044F|nr:MULTISPECIES: cupin domain-containing protein [unclassified Sphingomonas]MCR5869590.1 cupin domain-containing protein [Sphingomonas sp. J344]UUX98692.1 cupin domain-containing protein [Sphingomonas sp. J315]